MALERVQSVEVAGTWEEGIENHQEPTDPKMPSSLFPAEQNLTSDDAISLPFISGFRAASGRSLLRHAGTWEGSDLEECLLTVYATRGQVKL